MYPKPSVNCKDTIYVSSLELPNTIVPVEEQNCEQASNTFTTWTEQNFSRKTLPWLRLSIGVSLELPKNYCGEHTSSTCIDNALPHLCWGGIFILHHSSANKHQVDSGVNNTTNIAPVKLNMELYYCEKEYKASFAIYAYFSFSLVLILVLPCVIILGGLLVNSSSTMKLIFPTLARLFSDDQLNMLHVCYSVLLRLQSED